MIPVLNPRSWLIPRLYIDFTAKGGPMIRYLYGLWRLAMSVLTAITSSVPKRRYVYSFNFWTTFIILNISLFQKERITAIGNTRILSNRSTNIRDWRKIYSTCSWWYTCPHYSALPWITLIFVPSHQLSFLYFRLFIIIDGIWYLLIITCVGIVYYFQFWNFHFSLPTAFYFRFLLCSYVWNEKVCELLLGFLGTWKRKLINLKISYSINTSKYLISLSIFYSYFVVTCYRLGII